MRLPWSRREPPKVLLTAIWCDSCSGTETREHADSDAVFGDAKCPKCNGAARITMVYSGSPTGSS